MRILAFYLGLHDSNALLFDSSDKSFRYVKSERQFYVKRHHATLSWLESLCSEHRFSPEVVVYSDGDRNHLGNCRPSLGLEEMPPDRFQSFPGARWFNVDHHLAHCLSVWPLVATEDLDFGIALDGRGDHDRRVSIFRRPSLLGAPTFAKKGYNIGQMFDRIGRRMGLQGLVVDLAGKIMGLQAYGHPDFTFVEKWLGLGVQRDMFELVREADRSPLGRDFFDPASQPFRDWIASVHAIVELVILSLFKSHFSPDDVISYSGGCALNTVVNTRLAEIYRNLCIPPHAYDGGLSLGLYEAARLYLHLERVEFPGFPFVQDDEDFGYASDVTVRTAAQQLAAGRVVGWLQGKGEIGPRALGHRSLLLNPSLPDGKDRINRVKGREPWRPFAPSILPESRTRYQKGSAPLDFMLYAVQGTTEARDQLRACMHVDDSCRAQLVDSNARPELKTFEKLIREFASLTGVQGVLNTSYNEGGKPIVSTREQAVEFFHASPIDALVMGDQIITKQPGS